MKLQNDYYFIRQIYALFGCIIALSICLYFYNRNIRIATQNKVVTTTIVEKSCSGSKGSSSVYVSYKQLIYKVKYGRNACAELNLGEKIKLYYDNDYQYQIRLSTRSTVWSKSENRFFCPCSPGVRLYLIQNGRPVVTGGQGEEYSRRPC